MGKLFREDFGYLLAPMVWFHFSAAGKTSSLTTYIMGTGSIKKYVETKIL